LGVGDLLDADRDAHPILLSTGLLLVGTRRRRRGGARAAGTLSRAAGDGGTVARGARATLPAVTLLGPTLLGATLCYLLALDDRHPHQHLHLDGRRRLGRRHRRR